MQKMTFGALKCLVIANGTIYIYMVNSDKQERSRIVQLSIVQIYFDSLLR